MVTYTVMYLWAFSYYGFGSVPVRIRIQSGSRVLMAKKLKNYILFGSKPIFLGLHKERPNKKRSLQLSKEKIQHFKTWNFIIFSTFVGHFCPPGSGSGFWIRIRIYWPEWIRIQSETLLVTVRKQFSPWAWKACPPLRWWWCSSWGWTVPSGHFCSSAAEPPLRPPAVAADLWGWWWPGGVVPEPRLRRVSGQPVVVAPAAVVDWWPPPPCSPQQEQASSSGIWGRPSVPLSVY